MSAGDPKEFDVLNVALTGKNLVEAAAGTGKTYSIAIMVLRWILETKNKIDSVIAVTFTNYATAELKERILNFLETALAYFETGNCDDETIKTLCNKIQDKDEAVKKLKAAINDFDTSSIFTIHGFCQKIIREHAFELGIDFNLKLAEDANPSNDAATAFFRENIADFSGTGENGGNLLENNEFREKVSRDCLKDFISTAGISVGNANIKLSGNEGITTKLTEIYKNFAETAPEIAKRNRERKNIMGYDDILLILYEVLKGNSNTAQLVQKSMEERYSFVLIDEFQDTDPQQYFIFTQLFFSGRHTIFFIGDPKQSIYAFRKADIFAYSEAKNKVDSVYVMEKNFRSSSPAVNAVNEVFKEKNLFSADSLIEYNPVSAAKKPDEYFLAMNGKSEKGILVCELPNDGDDKPVTQEPAKKLMTNHIIQTVREMTKSDSPFRIYEKNGCQVSGRAVKLSDIAVLVATNNFALEVCDKLNNAGIHAAVEADSGDGLYIFSSEEALALQKLMSAASTKGLAEFKTLLLTFFYNKNITELSGENTAVAELYEKFKLCFEEWGKRGFYAAFSKFTADEEILKNIVAKNERTPGILRQLAELIHKHESKEGFSVHGTQKWFNDKIKSGSSGNEEENIRSESGKKECVRIMTLHKSKGLEFNIVFFPFILKSSALKKERWMTVHTKNGNVYERELQLVPKGEIPPQTDEAIEEIRRIYVGITRAKYLTVCYTQTEKKSLEPTSLFKRKEQQFIDIEPLSSAYCEEAPTEKENKASSATEQLIPPEKMTDVIKPDWAISSYSGITSKSHSEGGTSEDADTDQENSADKPVREETSKDKDVPMADFQRGAEAGTILHMIFEKADFTSDNNMEIISTILKKKMNFKSDEDLAAAVSAVSECLESVRTAAIFDNGRSLSDVLPEDKTTEMEFFVSIKNDKLQKRELSEIISDNYRTEELEEGAVRKGFLHGFIDLVAKIDGKYYIIDWKSNNLGGNFNDYDPESIREEMKKHNYYLQFMLYLAAFDKYMTTVDREYSYEKNFGGIRYVFLRGVKGGNDSRGIFSHKPDECELRKIQQLLEGEA